MTEIVPLPKREGHRLRETIYTERGLRLPEEDAPQDSRLFVPVMIVLPIALFLIVVTW